MKIVILDRITVTNGDIDFSLFNELGEVISYDITPPHLVAERVSDAEIALCNKALFTADVLRNCKNLKYIGLFATGYNNIDINTANELGITVCNAPDYSTFAVAQHVFALILSFYNNINSYDASVKNGDWIMSSTFSYFLTPMFELYGKTIGIVGYGSIGRRVAAIAKSFGMNVIVHTRTITENENDIEFVSIDDLFSKADVISLHCPLTEKTRGIVNNNLLKLMKKSAIIINTSRGPVINESDLADFLNKGLIAGAGLDVISVEPMKDDNPLKDAKNCIITPHVAWAPLETRIRLCNLVKQNLQAFMNGNPINIVK